ncbi:CDK5RAP1-like protein [Habropoda laboriosa]|uniref:CDK5RAP1-like protein n=1 Tax=Habropoda laboriosa TaxID=597456 RepID=A0A0L7QQB7_9HYME|nr:PREDICTED: CDK5RAP1-like protein [Habropoda laboriosa]KOC60749.1 CDK5RAP1-like protein [Habropoda laboriosa]
MNGNILNSLKKIKSSKSYQILLNKWHIKKFTPCNSVTPYNFQQHQAIHTHDTQLEISKETDKKTSDLKHFRDLSKNGPSLKDFLVPKTEIPIDSISVPNIPYIKNIDGCNQKVYFEVHGCQMNVNDTEVIWSILKSHGYKKETNLKKADIILLVTCSIRDKVEQKIWNKLSNLNHFRRKKNKSIKIGLLGCMAERLKDKILERGKLVDVIAGPDSYKDLPRLLSVPDDETAINVVLSFDETYADITPVRLNPNSPSAFVTIMRGCDNMCTYCIVPFTRGRERSRPIESIVKEVQSLSDDGVKEVVLLGQNVNSYRDLSQSEFYMPNDIETHLVKGFKTVYKRKKGGRRFCDLLDEVSQINPEMRIRFISPHPKDFPDEVLHLIAERPNICKAIHLPFQSGNSAVLERMRRGYTREAYIDLVNHIREILPNVCLSTDVIAGFCGETEEEFQDTLSMIELVKYNQAFLFCYSMREKTTAHRRYQDDVEQSVKLNRLERMTVIHRAEMEKLNKLQIGQLQLVLVEGVTKRSNESLKGRNDGNTRVVIPSVTIPIEKYSDEKRPIKSGDYVVVQIQDATSQSLRGIPLYHSSITEYVNNTM